MGVKEFELGKYYQHDFSGEGGYWVVKCTKANQFNLIGELVECTAKGTFDHTIGNHNDNWFSREQATKVNWLGNIIEPEVAGEETLCHQETLEFIKTVDVEKAINKTI